MKKIILTSLIFGFLLLGIQSIQAQCPTEGLVPCGTEGCPCTLCHFFELIENILDFILFKLVPPVAVLMLVIGGVMFFLAAGDPANLSRAKSVITTTVIGLIIVYGAFLVIGMFLASIGLSDWTENIYESWWNEGFFTIECSTSH